MVQNYRAADLPPRQKAMLDFAVKLTERPTRSRRRIAQACAAAGFTDRDIWDIAAVAAFYNMTNRMAAAADMRPNREYHYMVAATHRWRGQDTSQAGCRRHAADKSDGGAAKAGQSWLTNGDPALKGPPAVCHICHAHHVGRGGWICRPTLGWTGAGHAQHHCCHEHEGRGRQIHARAGDGRDAIGPVPQERAHHRFGLAGQRQRHAADGRQPASAAVGRPHHRRPAGGERAQQRRRRLAALRGRRRVRRRRGAHRLSHPERHAAHPVRARGLQGEPARPPAHQHRRAARPRAQRVRHHPDRLPARPVGADRILAARGRFPLLADQARLRLDLRPRGVPPLQGPQPGDGLCREPRRDRQHEGRAIRRWMPTTIAGSAATPTTAASSRPCRAPAPCSMPRS